MNKDTQKQRCADERAKRAKRARAVRECHGATAHYKEEEAIRRKANTRLSLYRNRPLYKLVKSF